MLLDRAAALAAKITSFQALKADATEAEAYANRAKQIRTVAGRLDKSAQGWRRLSQAGVKPDLILTTAGDLATKATDLREKLVEDRTVLQDPPFDLKYDFSDRLAKVSELADAAISKAWRQWVDDEARLSSDEVLTALDAIPQLRGSVRIIRQARQAIAGIAATAPEDPEAAKVQVRALIDAHDKAWADLTADEIPASVLTFIRACASEGASLSMLKDDVVNWLDQRGVSDAFRIRIR